MSIDSIPQPCTKRPTPSAPGRTLLAAIRAAQASTAGMGSTKSAGYPNLRRKLIDLADTQGPRLAQIPVSRGQLDFCAAGGSPWIVLDRWVQDALATP